MKLTAGTLLAPTLAILLSLAACSTAAETPPPADSSATTSPSPSASASGEPKSSPEPPSLPGAARGTSPAAAKAFVRHYIDAINYAAATGDLAVLRRLSNKNCISCEAIANNIDQVYDAGGRIESDGWSVRLIRVIQVDRKQALLSVGVLLGSETIVGRDGKEKTQPSGRQPMTIQVRFGPNGPTVNRLDLVT